MNTLVKWSLSAGTFLTLSLSTAPIVSAVYMAPGNTTMMMTTTMMAKAPLYSWGKATWSAAPGAKYYNVYYKESGDKMFTHAVRRVPANMTSYDIKFLKRGVTYWYNVSAVDWSGKEYWWAGLKKLPSWPMK
ncbi:fibronectin type III domain-containing protein [Candidatus Gottesmanbacteria bacterium]|nr:fibronectin type III domain-containing protein [Candidatus Gottesmanbacteria bacterium]